MFAQRVPYFLFVVLSIIFKVSCEKTSLTFVIDDTGSMYDDIVQVRNEVDAIMDIVLHEKSSQISNIVLTTFNDPTFQLRIITDNPKKLKNTLSTIYPWGGGYCPEMALSGIKLALKSSLPGSYIYVFTDASARDYRMMEEIQQLCQRKQSQIVFVLTGDCGNPNSAGFQVYYDIATASSGLAFRVDKHEVHKVVAGVIKESIQGNKNVLTTKKVPAHVWTNVPFSIDDQTEYAVVSASGNNVQIKIQGQYEEKVLLWTKHAKVVKLIHLHPGAFVATVKGSSTTSVNIVARNDFKFQHGFSTLEPKSINDTAPQPFKDTLTHLSISVTDPDSTIQVQSVQIMDINENKIGNNIPLKAMAPNFYITEPFVAPSHIFKVAVIGINTRTGKETRKIAKIPVIPQAPPKGTIVVKKPEVNIPEGLSIGVTAGTTVTLTCKVAAYPKPIITWRNKMGITIQSTSSQVQIPYDYISYLKIPYVSKDSKYYCHAVNSLNKDFKSISVIIKDPFMIKSVPKGTTKIYYGTEHTIHCDVQAIEPYKINWYHVDKHSGKNIQIMSSEKYSISSDSTRLKILSMDVDLIGNYTCEVHLLKDLSKNRMFNTNVEINGLVAPKIEPHSEVIEIGENRTAVIICKILKGVPEPAISWKFKPLGSGSMGYKDITGSANQLRVSRAQLHDSGSYRCVAVNVEGHDEQTAAELVVLKAPVVAIEEGDNIQVKYGSQMTLHCKVTAHPTPNVSWYDNKGRKRSVKMSGSNYNYQYIYTSTGMKESGKFVCRAKNKQGSETKSIEVTVPSPFDVQSVSPSNVLVTYSNPANLYCNIRSHLPMKIDWYLASRSAKEVRKLSSSDKYWISSDGTQLKIISMDKDLTGTYTCKAFLIAEPKKSLSFAVNVTIGGLVAPKIEPHSEIMEIGENGTAVISCKILKGVPKPAISWKFKPLGSGSMGYKDITGSANQLRVSRAQLHDSGSYRCVAVNVEGHDEQTVAELVVLKAPVVAIEEGDNIQVKYGSQMTLHCKVTAHPTPNVGWYDDKGRKLSIQSSGSNYNYQYIYTSTGMKESRKFVCRAKNKQGSETKSIEVTVPSPFDVQSVSPNNSVIMYGTPANLHCNIRSHLPIKIDWYIASNSVKEVRKLSSSDKFWISSDGTQLKIKSMDVDMTGTYTCKACLIEEPNKSISFAANVAIGGLEFPKIIGDINKKVTVGESVAITCNIVKGIPKPTVSWQYKTTNTDKFEDLKKTGNVLNIPSVGVFDAGFYKCTAENIEGTDELVIELTVEEPPSITAEEFTEYEGLKGDIAMRIPCDAVGNPKPTIEWKIEDSLVTIGNKYNIENGALIIKYPEQSDNNLYTCTATNYLGSDTKTFNGSVYDKLNSAGSSTNITLNTDISKKLECKLPRTDPSIVQWFTGEAVINGASIDVDDDGNFTCHVSDVHGSATETYMVNVVYGPSFVYIHEFPVVELNDDSLEVLHCNVNAKPDAEVQWIHNDKLLEYAGEELPYSEIGNYKCIVSNEYGTIERTFLVKEEAEPSIAKIEHIKFASTEVNK